MQRGSYTEEDPGTAEETVKSSQNEESVSNDQPKYDEVLGEI
jgi:hypothetical protein